MTEPAAITRPRRRWFRFSLRSLLVFTVLVGLLMGWIAKERRQSAREVQFVRELEDQRWNVYVGGPFDSVDINMPWKRNEQEWWRRFAESILGRRIHGLSRRGGTANDLSPWAELSSLKFAIFIDMHVGDLTPLVGLKRLERLSFANAGDIGVINPLARITSLKRLDLSLLQFRGNRVTQEQLDTLKRALPNCKIACWHEP